MEKGAMSACSPEPNVAALVPDGEQSSIRAVASESSDGSTTHGFGRRNKRSNRSGVDTPWVVHECLVVLVEKVPMTPSP